MGTSASKPDAPPGSPLLPPWADQDPVPPEPLPPEGDPEAPEAPAEQEPPPPAAPVPVAPAKRYNGFRRRLSNYMDTGDQEEGRKALGHWVRTSVGGAGAGTQRLSRALRTGGAVLTGLARAGVGQPPAEGQMDIRELAGLPSDVAIGRIVDAFCPAGIADEDAVRSAVGETLAEVLSGADTFDPAAVDQDTVRVVVLGFVAEIVFVTVMSDSSDALAALPPAVAIQRENGLRALIREATDIVGNPLLEAAGALLNAAAVTNLVSQIVNAVQLEMESWE